MIYVAGTIGEVQGAAITALAERRLSSPQIEQIDGGVIVLAEQSSMAAMVFNSYGGFGKVTIKGDSAKGKGIFAVSVITRSRIPNEPVGPGDALKGQNFNDSRIALSILDRINELAKQGPK